MAYQPIPQKEEGGEDKVWTSDEENRELLELILVELKVMNLHLSELTNEEYGEEDIR